MGDFLKLGGDTPRPPPEGNPSGLPLPRSSPKTDLCERRADQQTLRPTLDHQQEVSCTSFPMVSLRSHTLRDCLKRLSQPPNPPILGDFLKLGDTPRPPPEGFPSGLPLLRSSSKGDLCERRADQQTLRPTPDHQPRYNRDASFSAVSWIAHVKRLL